MEAPVRYVVFAPWKQISPAWDYSRLLFSILSTAFCPLAVENVIERRPYIAGLTSKLRLFFQIGSDTDHDPRRTIDVTSSAAYC